MASPQYHQIAELRASRKVVEKAAGVQRTAHSLVYSMVVPQWWDALTVALAEYDRLVNVKGSSE